MNRFLRLENLYDHLNDPLHYLLIVQHWIQLKASRYTFRFNLPLDQ